MLERFIAYNKKHNSPLVPYRYNNDPQLGRWVSNQRRSYKRDGLHPGQIELLESNGFVWDVLEHEWDENFQLLIEYKDREGHCKVPQNHKIDGANLGRWCSRQCYNKNRGTLDNVKEKQLNELGMVLDRYEFEWSENIKILIEYKEREGHCNVPYSHKEDGANLGLWLSRQRHCKKIGTLDIVKEKQLEELGTVWDAFEHEWDENIKLLIKYKDKEGNCNVPYNHKEEGANLGRWLIHQRYFKKRGTLDAVKEKQLEELGIVWNVNEHGWDEFSKLLIEYKHREGHCKVPRDHKEDGKNLGKWYSRQKYGKLSEVRQERLREISVIRDDPRTGTE
ncbi:hypothetical protein FRACYDRAFT_181410 [Fragilariopsis cylindrus CCMP1102]|uniref:Helicase-associated domain-containing protein n=1 Tax=Fragilariopsis cylindrus CCMP1102 TaxID=635003 RepID=A0A1E7FTY1_9STRA|nr:hypothetical protein FRACYDRAFT_181410 [Fragilariopsis cylindrus CCMP1102]|eukprot:OEU21608.1 hypothetical protein FRACYDRAFT_181410 [Fragilariopsis cylindrus CCMP1102]